VPKNLDGLGPRFRLESFVARGAWGSVYRGVDFDTGRPVAVKRLHDHLCEPTMFARFEREARLLAELDSPHVVRRVTDGRDVHGRPFLVLEWLEGEDLGRFRRTRRPSERQVVDIVRQAALGLAALHDAGIVHRDVKPSNFFLVQGPDGLVVKLIDLGIARTAGEATLTATGFTLGTPAYMSPEQARGDRHPGAPSDLFSLGVVLFELLSGRKPYRGDDMVSLAMKIVLQDPPRLREVLPAVSPAIDELCGRAMARSPADRFPSAHAMASALGWLAASDEPIEAAPDSDRDSDMARRRLVITDSGSIPTSPATLSQGTEQRVVTALFASFEDTAEPPAAIEAFRETTERHGGVFHGVLGPHRVAVFGASVGRGDEAARAARAAFTAASITGIRLSIATGRAVATAGSLSGGLIDRGLRDVKRGHGAVRVDETTARLIDGRFVIEGPRGERVLRPIAPAVDAFGPKLLGQPAPLVGRDREAASLLAMFEECVAEPVARAALVTGPPGAGKSRLRYELLRRAAASPRPPTVIFGRGDALGQGSPFGMLAPAIRRLAGVLDGEPLEAAQRKLTARLAEVIPAPALDRASAFLGELARVPFPDDRDPALGAARQSPMLMNDAMRAAWQDFIAAECAARPVIVVLEDLHWGDLPSVSFVDAALQHAADRPLFALAVARPEVHAHFPGIFAGRPMEELRLGALTRKASEKLTRHALGAGADEAVVRRVVERADGNAFYLEELIRAVAEGNRDDLPETVQGMVQARLDALGGEAKRVLRAGSVFGRTFWDGGVRALLGAAPEAPHPGHQLDRLVASEVVLRRREATLPGEIEYGFGHALVREAAYAMLTDDDRARGHRLAGTWLEGRGAPDAQVLAEHFARGGDPERARAWYARAAEQALEGNDLGAAIDRAALGAEGAEGELHGRLRLIQAEAHRWRGELAVAEERAAEALAALPPGGPTWFRAAGELAAAAGLLGHVERVESVAHALQEIPPDPELRSARVVCLCRAAIPLFWAGHAAADALFARIDELAGPAAGPTAPRPATVGSAPPAFGGSAPLASLTHAARALAHFSRATRALYAGRPEEHLREQRAAFDAFTAGGDARNAVNRQVAVGFAQGELGLYGEAEATLREALAAGERLGIFNISVRALNNLGHVLSRRGLLEEARAVEARAVEGCVAQGDPRLEAGSRLYLADILRLSGDLPGAEREARQALRLASSAPALRVGALGTLARVLVRAGRAGEALAAAEDAARLSEELGRLDEGESTVRLALAEARGAAGDAARAAEAIAAAAERVRERAESISDPAWRASFLAIAENVETRGLASAQISPPSPPLPDGRGGP
jgi:serine/threonine protein kinase/tetratricopeptide (TPR) repeat protein